MSRNHLLSIAGLASATLAMAGAAVAQEEAQARSSIVAACTAASPARGAIFSGPVLQVIDERALCVAEGAAPDAWVQVRLADVRRGEGRGALMAAAFAKQVICTADRSDGSGVVGRCLYDGAPIGVLVRGETARAQAIDWR